MANITDAVREKYGAVAASGLSTDHAGVRAVAEAFGYTPEELASIPAGANMGLSCGNPTATANHTKDAARVWWILRYWGVEDVRLLNGGWVGWVKGGHPTGTADAVPVPVKFDAKPRPARLATKDQLLKSLQGGGLQIVDARSEKEFCGAEKLTNTRAGAIPGAKQLEWIDLLDKDTQRFKPAADLRTLFAGAGVAMDKPTATHCQSGGRAAVMAFALELMGADGVSNYYPSWAEWVNAADTPVVPGRPRDRK